MLAVVGLMAVLGVAGLSQQKPEATPSNSLLIRFTAPPGIGFNRRGASTLSVSAPGFRQTFALSGTPDPADPENTLIRLDDLRIPFPKTMRGRLTLNATFYLCDRVNGVCTVQEQTQSVMVVAGQARPFLWRIARPAR